MTTAKAIKATLTTLMLVFSLTFLAGIVIPVAQQGTRAFVTYKGGTLGVADFVNLYASGQIAASADRTRIYVPQVQQDWCNRIIAPAQMGQPFYIEYPPWFFTLMIPLSSLRMPSAFLLWSIGWLSLCMVLLFINLRTSSIKSPIDRAVFLSMFLASLPTILSIKLGQTSLWVCTGIFLFWYGFRRRKDALAAAGLVLSSIKLQYTPFLLVPVLARNRYRLLLAIVAFEAVVLLATGLNVGWASFLQYPHFLAVNEANGGNGVAPGSMVNIRGLTYCLLSNQVSFVISGIAFLIALAYLFVIWRRPANSTAAADNDAWLIATTIALSVVASPHTHYHDCVILGLAAALTLKSISLRENAADKSISYQVWSLLLLFYPLASWLCYIYRGDTVVAALGVINLILAGAAVWRYVELNRCAAT